MAWNLSAVRPWLPAATERVRAVLGAMLGVLITAALSLWVSPEPAI